MLAIEFVRPAATSREHDLGECVSQVVASPTACRRVLQEMTQLARKGDLVGDPKWEPGRFSVMATQAQYVTTYRPSRGVCRLARVAATH